jgi:hypothetical protein
MERTNQIWVLAALIFLLILHSCSKDSFERKEGVPDGWLLISDLSQCYFGGYDAEIVQSGRYSASLKSIDNKPGAYCMLLQSSCAEKFKNKRIRLNGYMKSSHLEHAAVLWLRVDSGVKIVGFDNMIMENPRPVMGTTDWKKYNIVLDVPGNATSISYGALIMLSGQIWIDNLSIEIVDDSVETTGIKDLNILPELDFTDFSFHPEPFNLDFED